MKSDGDKGILLTESLMKQGVGYFIGNAGKIIAAITLIVATLTTFTNLSFTDLSAETFTITLCVMLISSYLMYFSLEDAGEKEGCGSEEYRTAYEKFLAVRERITPESIDELRNFCLSYAQNELIYRQRNYLCEHGLSPRDLDLFKGGKRYTRRSRRHLITAEKMRAVNLTPAMLLSRSHSHTKSELTAPDKRKLFASLITLIPSTLCTVFTVSVILSAKNGLTPTTVIDGMLKLSALPIIGFKGFLDGYKHSKEDKCAWLETKTRILLSFLSDGEK